MQQEIKALYTSAKTLKGLFDYLFSTSKKLDTSYNTLNHSLAIPMLKGTPHPVLLTANSHYSSPIASQFYTYLEGTTKREFTRDEWSCVVRVR